MESGGQSGHPRQGGGGGADLCLRPEAPCLGSPELLAQAPPAQTPGLTWVSEASKCRYWE